MNHRITGEHIVSYTIAKSDPSTKQILHLTEIKSFVLVLSALINAKSNLLESIRHWRPQSSNLPLTFLDFAQIADEVGRERRVCLSFRAFSQSMTMIIKSLLHLFWGWELQLCFLSKAEKYKCCRTKKKSIPWADDVASFEIIFNIVDSMGQWPG